MKKKKDLNAAKTLIIASIATLSMTGAYAAEDVTLPKTAEDNQQGTLDKLAGQDIPGSDPVTQYPQEGSAYTLTKVQEGGDKPSGDNIITKFTYNSETQTMTPVYYKLDLKKTEYGTGSETTLNYNWEKDAAGNYTLKEGSTLTGDNSISYKYDNSTALNRVENPSGDVVGNFINQSSSYMGGAIDNTINNMGDITGDFVGNSAILGGAIYSGGWDDSKIENISGNFIANSAASGGAIYNYAMYYQHPSVIGYITGNFIGNYVQSTSSDAKGGAIYNEGYASIENIMGDFIGNYATSTSSDAKGGAIYNEGYASIENITGDFIGNYISSRYADGGAIYNSGTIGDITGDYIANYASGSSSIYGGAIYNSGTIGDIKGDFIGNYVQANSYGSYGGAIRNCYNSQIANITGDFIDNHAIAGSYGAQGGAIHNAPYSNIESITGDFIGNYTVSSSQSGYDSYYSAGGAIYNESGSIGNIIGDFINNYSEAAGYGAYGGAICGVGGNFRDITGNFIGNHTLAPYAYGGAIAFVYGSVGNITGDFIDNSASGSSVASGGAIYNKGTIGEIQGSFINNYAKSETGEAKGGAIYSTKDLTIVAKDGKQSVFSGNYTESKGVKDDNAIYLDNSEGTLSFKMTNGGTIYMEDNIDGAVDESNGTITSAYNVDIQGDRVDNTTFYMLNDIRNADVTVGNTTLNTINNQVHTYDFNSLTLTGDTNMLADVDLANESMDRFTANSYGEHQGNLHVVGMNMLSDAPEGRDVTEIYFAQVGLKDNVVNGVSETPTSSQTTAYTPIYKYHVMYDNRDDAGYFMFTKGDKIFVPDGNGGTTVTPTPGGNASDAYNPSVLATPVAAQAGAYAAQNAAFSYAFQHADTFMPLPSTERFALRHSNEYAITSYDNLSLSNNDFHDKAIWVRPYTSFENIPLKNGPKVDTITYGTLVGGDSVMKELRNGWGTVFTGYMGYNGSSQSYSGVNTYQNGGLIGATQTFYKGNFFTAITASAGASAGESHNMYGHENFSTLMAGVASKSGYNIEFKEGKYIIQPTLMLSYSFINTFDYRNSAGVKINSDPLHAIQINPNIRFIANYKNGWQPYASVGMVWNILDDTKVMANDVRLPEMSIKPYVEYGLGVQKRWKDKYTGYVQAMIRNGGRNGIALTGGFRWAIGKEGKPIQKVSNPQNKTAQMSTGDRKIIKQLTPAQKTALGAKPQNTTRTTASGALKQL